MENTEKLPYWEQLTSSEKEYVCQNAAVKTYDKGEDITACGGICLGMIYVLSGQIRVFMLSQEGREVTLFRLREGDSCVLSASCLLSQLSFDVNLVTTDPTELLVVNSSAYGKLMEANIHVKCFSYELALERSSAIIWVLQQIIFARFDTRLAGFLLDESARAGRDEITMSKEAIAREVNTAREVVSRMLKTFVEEGLIQTDHKTIRLLDKPGLQRLL